MEWINKLFGFVIAVVGLLIAAITKQYSRLIKKLKYSKLLIGGLLVVSVSVFIIGILIFFDIIDLRDPPSSSS
jgi:hypothetical protein